MLTPVALGGAAPFTLGLLSFAGPSGSTSVTVGGSSTVKALVAGVGSVFPSGSVAVTWNVWGPGDSGPTGLPELQLGCTAPSIRHSKSALASLEVKTKAGLGSTVPPDGPEVMVVSGSVVSALTLVLQLRVTDPEAGTVRLQLMPTPLS